MYSKVIATLEEASDTRNEQGMINIEKLRALWRVSILKYVQSSKNSHKTDAYAPEMAPTKPKHKVAHIQKKQVQPHLCVLDTLQTTTV